MTPIQIHELTCKVKEADTTIAHFTGRLATNPKVAITHASNLFAAVAMKEIIGDYLAISDETARIDYLAHSRDVLFSSPIDMAGNLFFTLYFTAQKDARLLLEHCRLDALATKPNEGTPR